MKKLTIIISLALISLSFPSRSQEILQEEYKLVVKDRYCLFPGQVCIVMKTKGSHT